MRHTRGAIPMRSREEGSSPRTQCIEHSGVMILAYFHQMLRLLETKISSCLQSASIIYDAVYGNLRRWTDESLNPLMRTSGPGTGA